VRDELWTSAIYIGLSEKVSQEKREEREGLKGNSARREASSRASTESMADVIADLLVKYSCQKTRRKREKGEASCYRGNKKKGV